jgi:hypothetical protein
MNSRHTEIAGTAWRDARAVSWSSRFLKNGSSPITSAGVQLGKGREGGVDLAFGAGLQDEELYTLRARRFLHVPHHALENRVRVDE